MTTADMLLRAPVGATTAMVGPKVRIVPIFVVNERPVVQRTTDAALAHVQAMRELAALSFDPDSLDRGLEEEINHNAWGIREA
jgi:hypothetical protein